MKERKAEVGGIGVLSGIAQKLLESGKEGN